MIKVKELIPLSEITLEDAARVYELAFNKTLKLVEADYLLSDGTPLRVKSYDNYLLVGTDEYLSLEIMDGTAESTCGGLYDYDVVTPHEFNLSSLAYLIREGYDLGELSKAVHEVSNV